MLRLFACSERGCHSSLSAACPEAEAMLYASQAGARCPYLFPIWGPPPLHVLLVISEPEVSDSSGPLFPPTGLISPSSPLRRPSAMHLGYIWCLGRRRLPQWQLPCQWPCACPSLPAHLWPARQRCFPKAGRNNFFPTLVLLREQAFCSKLLSSTELCSR